jgi:hypothetical protein
MINISKLDLDYFEKDIAASIFQDGQLAKHTPHDGISRYVWANVKAITSFSPTSAVLADLGLWEVEGLDWRHMSDYSREIYLKNLDKIVDVIVGAMFAVKRG